MPLIDAHVHLYPPEVNRAPAAWAAACGETHWGELCTRRGRDDRAVQGFPTVDQLLRDMDAASVSRVVLLGWYWERPETCRMQNRFYAECVRAHPDRLSAFSTMHPSAGEEQALGEIWLARDSGLVGLGELSPHSQGYGIHDPVFCAVLKRAGEYGMPVNLHVTDPHSRPYPGRVETPLEDFIAVALEFPGTNFILAHWGGGLAFDPVKGALPNVYYDTAASPLLYGPAVWAKAPPGRVLFGSDYPLVLYPKSGTAPEFAGILQEAQGGGADEALLGGNAAGLLGLG